MPLNNPLALPSVLSEPSAIKFRFGSDDADFAGMDLAKNPQKVQANGPFVWFLNDRTEASVTVVGKVIYTAIGDKTGPYFSLPDAHYMPDVASEEMGKAKVGFAVRLINRDLVVDSLLPDILSDHNQAAIEYFLTIQERADARLAAIQNSGHAGGGIKPSINVKSFLKLEEHNPFYVFPVVSEPVFPQFKGPRTPGVVRTGRQRGRISLNPAHRSSSEVNEKRDPNKILFRDLPDPKNRFVTLKSNPLYHRFEMCVPPVFTADGNLVLPSQYEDMIPDGTMVAVRGKMKMYDILSRDRLFVNRPFLFVFDRLQVVDNEMVGWTGSTSSTEEKEKRRYSEVDSPEGEAFKRRNIDFDEPISEA